MDAYLLDTSVASTAWDALSPRYASVRGRLAALSDARLFVCAITLGEVEYGLGVSPGVDSDRHAQVRSAMREYELLALNRHTTSYYGRLRAELFKQYSPRGTRGRLTSKRPEELMDGTTALALGIQENDLWIVSVAVQYDVVLVTLDAKLARILEVATAAFAYSRGAVWEHTS